MNLEKLPPQVTIGECWARDGLQNEKTIVSTTDKVRMINHFQAAGYRRIEATSFAHPAYLPQFSDAEAVLQAIDRRPGVEFRAVVTTQRGLDRAIQAKSAGFGVDEIALIISASEAHNRNNVKMGRQENQRLLEQWAPMALASGHHLLGWVLTSFGCPFQGDVPMEDVIALGRWWKSLGARFIGFGDTSGTANPQQVARFYTTLFAAGFEPSEIVVHFHDTRGTGIANNLVALSCGLTHFDTSIGAIGGQAQTGSAAYLNGHGGNTCTEDFVALLHEMAVDTGLNLPEVIAAGHSAESILGRRLRANVIHCGMVQHQPKSSSPVCQET